MRKIENPAGGVEKGVCMGSFRRGVFTVSPVLPR